MRIIKHAFLSLLRKPTKAIMILIILFVVFALVFTCIIIQNSVAKSKEFIRKELGAVVEMRADYVKAMTDQLDPESYKQLSLSSALAKELAKDSAVKKLYITEMTFGSHPILETAQKEGGAMMSVGVAVPGGGTSFPLIGSNELIPIGFENGSLTLVNGRHQTSEDQNRNTLLISEELASKNNLSIGDSLEFTSFSNNQAYTFEVIGTFSGSESFSVDLMYTSLDSVKNMAGTLNDENNADSINFILHDPLEVNNFIARQKDQIPSKYIYLYAGDSEYKTLTRPLDLISAIVTILLWVVFIAGAIIMIAIVTIFVRDRKFEIGLLLSSGESKIKITSQFVLEIIIVSVLAFIIAAGSSQFSSGFAADWIVTNQLVEQNEDARSNMVLFGSNASVQGEINMRDVADDFDVSVDNETIINLILISLGLILFSTSAPLLIILSYKPREALQD